ncbi:MAG: SDR family oxidoreductase [Planctomycetes bacterium]|nr:SDR family oxidoreductase [Planctomycetota bacterium]
MDLALKDKVVWITGASGGIGRALAQVFAAEGAQLALHGHGGFDALGVWVHEQPWGARALLVRADVRSADELSRCADEIRARYGRIDVCCANAGKWPSEPRDLHELTPERLQDTLQVNLLGALFTARAFLSALAATGPRADGHGAALIFTGSTAGRFGERGHVDYAVAKAALRGAVKTLKNEIVRLDPYGRVNAVEPGWTVTHMARPALAQPGTLERVVRTMALRQLARAEDVARTVAWLASPSAAAHVSGESVSVAGGMEGRLLWNADEVDRAAVLARLQRPD